MELTLVLSNETHMLTVSCLKLKRSKSKVM